METLIRHIKQNTDIISAFFGGLFGGVFGGLFVLVWRWLT